MLHCVTKEVLTSCNRLTLLIITINTPTRYVLFSRADYSILLYLLSIVALIHCVVFTTFVCCSVQLLCLQHALYCVPLF